MLRYRAVIFAGEIELSPDSRARSRSRDLWIKLSGIGGQSPQNFAPY